MAQAMMDGVVLPLATENSEENASSSPDSPELQACKQEMQQLTSQLREKLAVNGLYAWSGQNGLTLSANELHSSASCCQCSSTPSPTHSTSPLLSNSGSTRTNCTFLEEEKQEDEDEEEEDIEEDAHSVPTRPTPSQLVPLCPVKTAL